MTVTNNTSLSQAAYNRINWAPVRDAVGYTVSRVTGGPSQGIIAVVPAGNRLECEPAGALVTPSFPLLPTIRTVAEAVELAPKAAMAVTV